MTPDRGLILRALADALDAQWSQALEAMKELSASLGSETKSSAGDKHETGRAMVQLEMEQAGQRVARCESMKAELSRLNPEQAREIAGPGAVVVTDRAVLFIGPALGGFEVDGVGKAHAISPEAPMALALRGARSGETVDFRGQTIRVLHVV